MILLTRFSTIVVTTLFLLSCSSPSYLSRPASVEALTDGNPDEWSGRFAVQKEAPFALAVSHSKNYLYIAITSMEREFKQQVSRQGLTLWLDTKGRKSQVLGIKFEGALPKGRPGSSQMRSRSNDLARDPESFQALDTSLLEGDLTLIVIDKEEGQSLGPADLLASSSLKDGKLLLEYQIPITLLGRQFDREKLGLGIVSGNDAPGRGDRPRGGMRPGGGTHGGMAGGMSGGPGMGGPPSGGMRPDRQQIDTWVKVKFSK